jgi:hypothetical protein
MTSYYFTIQGKKVNWHSTLLLFDKYLIFETAIPIKIEGINLKFFLDSIDQLNANIKNGKFYFDKISSNLSFKMTKQLPFNPIEGLMRKISKG